MREIKFRGFSKYFTENEWCVGDLIQYDKDEVEDEYEFYILPQNYKYWDISYDGIKVDKDSIGQYTGLKDKYNTEIYEGDILEFSKGGIMYVEWNDDFKMFVLVDPRGKKASLNICIYATEHIKVIGNIFENKELLKIKK